MRQVDSLAAIREQENGIIRAAGRSLAKPNPVSTPHRNWMGSGTLLRWSVPFCSIDQLLAQLGFHRDDAPQAIDGDCRGRRARCPIEVWCGSRRGAHRRKYPGYSRSPSLRGRKKIAFGPCARIGSDGHVWSALMPARAACVLWPSRAAVLDLMPWQLEPFACCDRPRLAVPWQTDRWSEPTIFAACIPPMRFRRGPRLVAPSVPRWAGQCL
jgi:hypothetical protein